MGEDNGTLVQRLLRFVANLKSEGDERAIRPKQIDQYFGKDSLPDATRRPTSLTKFLDQPFKTWPREMIPLYLSMVGSSDLPMSTSGGVDLDAARDRGMLPYKFNADTAKVFAGDDLSQPFKPLQTALGAGRATNSLGYDEENDRYYVSTFDSWDFDKGSEFPGPDLQRRILEKHGEPFNMYERHYIDRLGMDPTRILSGPNQGRDIKLPLPAGAAPDPRLPKKKP